MTWLLIICSAACMGAILQMVYKKVRSDPGLNARIVIIWGEKVNDAAGGSADILDDEMGGTTIMSGNLSMHHIALENLATGVVTRGRFIRELVIGREPRGVDGCIMVPDEEVSRLHCRIFWSAEQLYLEDLNSSNHTYLNGELANVPVRIQDGDIIYMGKEAYRYQNLG